MSCHPPEWQGILDEDEDIVWQGQPSRAVKLEFSSPLEAVVAAFFIGFSIFWMNGASQAGGYFWMFGLIFLGVGIYRLVGQHFWKARQRRSTFYTLTNKRAFIAKVAFNGQKALKSYPITAETPLSFTDHGTLGSVIFKSTQVLSRRRKGQTRYRKEQIGFELLPDGRDVFALMRKVQNDNPKA